jgi:hypothetical protein
MGTRDFELIQHQPQKLLSGVTLWVNGCEMLRDGHFVVYSRGITVPNADL